MIDADDLFKSLGEELKKLCKLDENDFKDTLSAESFSELDSEVVTSASCMSHADILAKFIRSDSIEDEDVDDNNDDDLNHNTDDLDYPTPLTWMSKGDIKEALDKLQDLHCSVPMGMKLDLLL